MGLMARAARMAARQGREAITEDDIYAAMENKAMEAYAVGSCAALYCTEVYLVLCILRLYFTAVHTECYLHGSSVA